MQDELSCQYHCTLDLAFTRGAESLLEQGTSKKSLASRALADICFRSNRQKNGLYAERGRLSRDTTSTAIWPRQHRFCSSKSAKVPLHRAQANMKHAWGKRCSVTSRANSTPAILVASRNRLCLHWDAPSDRFLGFNEGPTAPCKVEPLLLFSLHLCMRKRRRAELTTAEAARWIEHHLGRGQV